MCVCTVGDTASLVMVSSTIFKMCVFECTNGDTTILMMISSAIFTVHVCVYIFVCVCVYVNVCACVRA